MKWDVERYFVDNRSCDAPNFVNILQGVNIQVTKQFLDFLCSPCTPDRVMLWGSRQLQALNCPVRH